MEGFFKRRANRFCIFVDGYWPIPVATAEDDQPVFETTPPMRIGDDAIIHVEGKRRKVRLLPSSDCHLKVSTYLIDMGAA